MVEIQKGIQLDEARHPLILVQGNWMRWEDLNKIVRYDEKKKEIVSRDDPEKEWNYFAPNGLTQQKRYNQIYPVYQLSKAERALIEAEGEKFGAIDLPKDKSQLRYMQVFTSHNSPFAKLSHVAFRLIDENGKVYSSGFETPSSEIPFDKQKFVGTYHISIASLDYDELKPYFSRRVTTIPLTEEQYTKAFKKMERYSQKKLSLNRLHQNCATYTTNIMRAAGHKVEIRCTLIDGLPSLAPRLVDIPQIGPFLNRIRNFVAGIFNWISTHCIPHFVKVACESIATFVSPLAGEID